MHFDPAYAYALTLTGLESSDQILAQHGFQVLMLRKRC